MEAEPLNIRHPSQFQILNAVPVLEVADVATSLVWYREMLGFQASTFPEVAPFQFAILRHGTAELMLQRGSTRATRVSQTYRWNVYLRLTGGQLQVLYARLSERAIVTRRLERMFYGLAEFEVTDPDGYVLCLSEELPNQHELPRPEV